MKIGHQRIDDTKFEARRDEKIRITTAFMQLITATLTNGALERTHNGGTHRDYTPARARRSVDARGNIE